MPPKNLLASRQTHEILKYDVFQCKNFVILYA